MRRLVSAVALALLLVVLGSLNAYAERDIVYAARYYLKPGSHGRSYSHLYRINPDGSGRTRITRAAADDTEPKWSPDGRRILFHRVAGSRESLCLVSAEGGRVRTLISGGIGSFWDWAWNPDGGSFAFTRFNNDVYLWIYGLRNRKACQLMAADSFAWSPDGKLLYGSSNDQARIFNLRTGTSLKLGSDMGAGTWLNRNILLAFSGMRVGTKPTLQIRSSDGTIRSQIPVRIAESDVYGLNEFPDVIYTIPGSARKIIYGAHAGETTGGPAQVFFFVDLSNGSFTQLVRGKNLARGPRGTEFVTGSARGLAERGANNFVWVSSLSLASLNGAKKSIVSGLVWVDGFDWR